MGKQPVPTKEEVESYLKDRRNWGRWGDKSGAGTINLITQEKRLSAVKLVKTGRSVSLSRPVRKGPAIDNPHPALHYMSKEELTEGNGLAFDFFGVFYHGPATTHIDAVCHVWTWNAMWDDHDPSEEITFDGSRFGSVDAWADGILTRGVLLDVPKYRKKPYVTMDEPLHGWELEEIVEKQGVTIEPGDAVVVYSGREAYVAAHGVYGGGAPQPGLHASCLPFIKNSEMSVLVWDMMDSIPNEYGLPFTVHGAIPAHGVALLDNALLQPLAEACAQEGRYDFMLTVNPLVIVGGTGSPVNPIATF